MSRAVAARRVTAARSPVTVSASTNIRRPSSGSSTSKSISSRQGSWSSARAAWADGHDRRRQDGQSRDGEKAPVGFPAPDLQRLGHVVVTLAVPAVLTSALPEPAHPSVAALPALARLLALPPQSAPGFPDHQPNGAGSGLHRLPGRGRLRPHQLGGLPGVAPRPQPVLQQVGGHQGQPPTAYLAHHHRHANQPEEDGQGHAHLGRADGGVAVGPIGQSEYGHHRHDLREGEPQQHPVLGLHMSRYLVFSHLSFSFLTCPIR